MLYLYYYVFLMYSYILKMFLLPMFGSQKLYCLSQAFVLELQLNNLKLHKDAPRKTAETQETHDVALTL